MPPQSTPFTEARTVENPILKWLRTPELGWRYENQQAVTKKYRTDPNGVYDEREILLLPILRQKLKELNPTIIIVVDRDQLQDQMVKQFIQTNTENCRVAERKDDLLALLRDGDGYRGIILTIMHKFDWRDAVVINRPDVIMLVDEAQNESWFHAVHAVMWPANEFHSTNTAGSRS